jgi:chromosome partitioning protein
LSKHSKLNKHKLQSKQMKTIALLNQKGGVGKTTSTVNIGAGLCKLGKKVLLIDLDPQANLTYSLGIQGHDLRKTIYELLKGQVDITDVIVEKDGLKVIPSSLDLSGAEIELSGTAGREFLLRESLSKLNNLDYILLDCPPSLSLLTLNSLVASNEVYIPVQTEFLALQGMSKLLQTVEIVKKRLNTGLEITGIIGTRYDSRKTLNKEVVQKVQSYFGAKLFKTLIRDNVSLAEAPSFGQDIFAYKPDSNGAEDYLKLCKEILKREKVD